MKLNDLLRLSFIIISTLLSLAAQQAYSANDAGSCHCFRDRTFNPEDTFASDDYLLTTTFNSLLASEFDITKRQVIMMKMREGIANNDLVTALYIAKNTGLNISKLLQMKKQTPWHEIIRLLHPSQPLQHDEDPFGFISADLSDDEITEQITDKMISNHFNPSPESVTMLRQKGLQPREIIVVYTLAAQSGESPAKIANIYSSGSSWSKIAHDFGLEPAKVGKLLEHSNFNGKK